MVLRGMDAQSDNNTFKKLSTEERVFSTGAQRDTSNGKGAFHWMPWTALFLVSRIYENGNKQRGIRNWEKGMPISDYLNSAQRHLVKYLAGERSEPHLSQAIWNMLNALQTAVWIRQGHRSVELNDLPDHYTGLEPGAIDPLSSQESEWLKPWGIELKPWDDVLIPKPMVVDEEKIAADPLVKHIHNLVNEEPKATPHKAKVLIEDDEL
jgi:hypothetical protein